MRTKNNNLSTRKLLIMGVFIAIGVVFIVKLFALQVVDQEYKEQADNNALRFVTQYPARGKVYDRNGELLVFNEAVYDLMVTPKQIADAVRKDTLHPFDTLMFCHLLDIDKASFIERMDKAKKESYFKSSPFMTQVSKESYAHIAEVLYRFPGFYFQTRTVRHYPKSIAAHTLGDIGEISKAELDKDTEGEKYYRRGDYIGKSGIEKSYEKELRGKKGLKVMMVDVHNREMGSYKDGELDEEPVAGKDIYLGLDAELQAYGEQLMVGKIGSIVAVEPSTGQILAFVTSPTYDPNLLVGRERGQHYKELQADPMKPLINRAISGTYPPGSTFKTVVGLIAMQSGSITPATCFHCSGTASLPIKCTHSHGSSPDFANAIMNSCNPYFYESFKATINNPKFLRQDVWRPMELGDHPLIGHRTGRGARDTPAALQHRRLDRQRGLLLPAPPHQMLRRQHGHPRGDDHQSRPRHRPEMGPHDEKRLAHRVQRPSRHGTSLRAKGHPAMRQDGHRTKPTRQLPLQFHRFCP